MHVQSGPAAVPANSYWPTVDYGICVGSPHEMHLWTDLIHDYVGAMVDRYPHAIDHLRVRLKIISNL